MDADVAQSGSAGGWWARANVSASAPSPRIGDGDDDAAEDRHHSDEQQDRQPQ
jgi:hypothetical protein